MGLCTWLCVLFVVAGNLAYQNWVFVPSAATIFVRHRATARSAGGQQWIKGETAVRPLLLVCICLLGVVGCAVAVSEAELREQAKHAEGDTLGQVYYLGRKDGYDYFRIQWNVGDSRYRIAAPNDVVREPQPMSAPARLVGPHELDRWLP